MLADKFNQIVLGSMGGMTRRVVVTAVGVVSPLGHSAEQFFEALCAGKSGIRAHTEMDLSHWVGWVDAPLDQGLRGNQALMLDRVTKMALFAAQSALQQEPVLTPDMLKQTGVYMGTGIGGVTALCDAVAGYYEVIPKKNQLVIPAAMPNAPTAHIAQLIQTTQEAQTYATACSAGAVAIGEAFRRIRDGYVHSALAGGSEAMIQPELLRSWEQLHVLCAQPNHGLGGCRPFSAKRNGFALGEGAAVFVLESLDHALKRGALPLVEIIGYGSSNDGTHPLRPSAAAQALAMTRALQDAGVCTTEVQYINAHATGTPIGDRIETEAIKKVFGADAYQLPVSSIKGAIGHLIGACGAVEAASVLMALRQQIIPPTIHYTPDAHCDLDYVPNKARAVHNMHRALSNSFGMGGNNAALLFQRYLN